MNSDPIADYLTRIRNAIMAKHKIVAIPSSRLKKEITKILKEQGYIFDYKFEDNQDSGSQGKIMIALKYDKITKTAAISSIKRVSKPGLRNYASSSKMPRVLNGLGISIVSTSKGVMTGKDAKKNNVGGEVICHVY